MSEKITQLTEDTSPSITDVIEFAKDPSGTPLSRKLQLQNFLKIINGLTAKTTLVDADEDVIIDSAASNAPKKITWANRMLQIAAYTTTLTNKRITPRVTSITSSATPTINTDNCDVVTITALAAAITSMTTNLSGTPTNFQKLIIRIKDDGTARAITWGTSFQSGTATLPTTTVLGKTLMVGLIYDSVDSKWTCEAVGSRA